MDVARPSTGRRVRRIPVRRLLLAVLAMLLLALTALWWQRVEIAQGLLDRELARRGVPARFRVVEIGFVSQRVEDLVIGDPGRPDLIAAEAVFAVSMGWDGPTVSGVEARGVRVRGRLEDGRLRLGAIERLLPPPSDQPFALPAFDVRLVDARLLLDSPYGSATIRIDGSGNLADDFEGRGRLAMPALVAGDCRVDALVGDVTLAISDGSLGIDGPVRSRAVGCVGAGAVDSVTISVDMTLSEELDAWDGVAEFDVARATAASSTVDGVQGRLTFAGTETATEGELTLAGAAGRTQGARTGPISMSGRYMLGATQMFEGRASVARARLDRSLLAPVEASFAVAGGTPLGPVAAAIMDAMRRSAEDFTGHADLRLTAGGGSGANVRLHGLEVESRSGARLLVEADGEDGVRLGARPHGTAALRLEGGGFPSVSATLRRPEDGRTQALLRIGPYAAGDARIELAPVRIAEAASGDLLVSTRLRLDGPIGTTGRVEGLEAPLALRLGATPMLAEGCAQVSFDALRLSGLSLDPAALSVCPVGQRSLFAGSGIADLRIESPRLTGRLGASPIAVEAGAVDYAVRGRAFVLAAAAMRIGADRVTRITADRFAGRIEPGGFAGAFTGGGVTVDGVPLVVGEAAGPWRYADGALILSGGIAVTDAATPARFERLVARDLRFRLAEGFILADAALRAPGADAIVTQVGIRHALGPGVGEARLDVPGLTFSPDFQPEAITRLTLGVIADVAATLTGDGRIGWGPNGVTSSGRFRTENASLAAAFGPIAGLTTSVVFTDLLALESAPNQLATVRSINPGIEILDGVIRYQLLREQRVAVESGDWPLAGGRLAMEPALLDFGTPGERQLVFTADGLDAGRFIGRFDLDGVAATGTFDGRLPIRFGESGGRIIGGRLASRAPGGTLSYNGELSRANLGTWGSLAFDALRSIRYDELEIGLDGAIDGEMVTQVRFSGVNRETPHTRASFILSQFTNLPFVFNIRIEAPFRGLIASLRGFGSAEELLRQRLPQALPRENAIGSAVQPDESESAS